VERRYSSYSFLTSALDGGEWSASRRDHALPPGKGPPVPIGQEAGWVLEPVWMQRIQEKSSASVGDRTPVIQSIASHYTDWATLDPQSEIVQSVISGYGLDDWNLTPDRVSLISHGYKGLFPWGWSCQSIIMTTRLNLMQKLECTKLYQQFPLSS
jgi:hypothetical protein